MTRRTIDGVNIQRILRVVGNLSGVTIREGTNHPYILNYQGLRPCPLARSTHARRMVVPWVRNITNYSNSDIYSALQRGRW